MGRYTDSLKDLSFDLYPDDDDFEQKLAEVAGQFRPFDVALTAFLVENGMIEETASADEIVEFITGRFKAAGIEPPRHRKKWFSEHKSIKRDTAFDLCFALGLSLDQAEDFFRRVCLERGFDGHDMKEIVFRYAIRKGLSYAQARGILGQIPTVKTENKIGNGEIVYTEMIQSEVDEMILQNSKLSGGSPCAYSEISYGSFSEDLLPPSPGSCWAACGASQSSESRLGFSALSLEALPYGLSVGMSGMAAA